MNKTIYKIITTVIAAAVFFSAWAFLSFGRPVTAVLAADGDGTLTLHFIDCGQADACVIELPDGKSMLIDAGENKSASYGNIITYIKDKTEIEAFDYFILTHSDADHIGGVAKVLIEFPAKTVYRPNQRADYTGADKADFAKEHYADPAATATDGSKALRGDYSTKYTSTYVTAIETLYTVADDVYVTDPNDDKTNNITGQATVNGEALTYTFDFYSPLSDKYGDNNNYSPIMVLSYAGRNIVLSGDAEKENEKEFVSLVRDSNVNTRYDRFRKGFKADIIKMGHHGSETSSSQNYLEIMCANESARRNTFTIFSCGENKSYGHPHEKTLQRLMDMKFSPMRIRRTDLQGNIRFDIAANGGIAEKHDREAELDAMLTCGLSNNDKTHPLVTVKDNGIRPTENAGEIDDPDPAPQPSPANPFLDFWNGLPQTTRIIVIVVAVVVVILIVAICIAVQVRKSKKKKSGKRGRKK